MCSIVKRGVKYAILVLVAEVDNTEWQERYLCKVNDLDNESLTLEAIVRRHPVISKKGHIVNTAYGKRIKYGNSLVWYTHKAVRYSDAKLISELRVLPFLNIT